MNDTSHHLWIEIQKRRRVKREALRQVVLRDLGIALTKLGEEYKWTALYLFGSATRTGRFGQSSDVDIAIEGLEKNRFYSFVGELSSLLNRSVDVVNLEECNFSEAIISRGQKWNSKKTHGFS